MPEIKLGHRSVAYQIRESKRARYISFRIDAKRGLQVVVPHGAFVPDVEDLLRERQTWILKNLHKMEQFKEEHQPRPLNTGDMLPYLGQDHQLEIILTKKGRESRVTRQGNFLRVRMRGGIDPTDPTDEIRGVLEYWYRQQAKTYIPKRATVLAQKHGFALGKITIRGQKTRWGSCSSKGNLNFNWRLMMTPPAAIDYVIIHELCHLQEMNHSPRFWAPVADLCPNYEYWKRWLKDHSPRLYL